jgi:endonuclease YncB( thermonuclease family)
MFGWYKRNDGFEWREYVRTTILVRRRDRRERVGQAAKDAVQNLKAAGARGAAASAVGAQAFGRGAAAAGQKGAVYGAAGIRAADSKLRAGLPVLGSGFKTFAITLFTAFLALLAGLLKACVWLWDKLAQVAVWLWDKLAPLLAAGWQRLDPLFAVLRQPSLSFPLAIAGGVAVLGAVGRLASARGDSDAVIALLIGSLILCALLAARWSEGRPEWVDRLLEGSERLGSAGGTIARGLGAVAVLAIVVGAALLGWRAIGASSGHGGSVRDASEVEGRGVALSGDTLRVARTTIRLSGIEAPVQGQTCASGNSASWRCDTAAREALARALAKGRVRCRLGSSDDDGRRFGTCHTGEKDVAAELVSGGHVFATSGLFTSYGSLESAARAGKAGIWAGEAARPEEYRAQKWEEAKRDAPDGCPIKGNAKGGRRIYVLPWAQGYERVRMSGKGDRWFCSESEARQAGWKPSEQS